MSPASTSTAPALAERGWTLQHERIARHATRGYYLPGAEHEDLVQEARIGVMKAITSYRPDRGCTFATFAATCARAEVVNAVHWATRNKRTVFDRARRFDEPIGDDGLTLGDFVAALDGDPEHVALQHERVRAVLAALDDLTPLERECVVRAHIYGEPYDDIGPRKRVDNALQRAGVKLRAVA